MSPSSPESRLRIAVAGGTGLTGRLTTKVLQLTGHETVGLARTQGIDLTTGTRLRAALDGVDAVIDVTNTQRVDPAAAHACGDTFGAWLRASAVAVG